MEIIRNFSISNIENRAKSKESTAIRRMRADYDHNQLGIVFFSNTACEYVYDVTDEELDNIVSEKVTSIGKIFNILLDGKWRRDRRVNFTRVHLAEALDY